MEKQINTSHRAKSKDQTTKNNSWADRMMSCTDNLHRMLNHSWMYCMVLDKNPFKSRLFDPHSRHEQYKVSNHMERQIDSSQTNYIKTIENNSWADLPQDILSSILCKMHFPDQICSLAVCKNWRLMSEEYRRMMTCKDHLPWVMNLSWMFCKVRHKNPFQYRLFDPHSRRLYKVSNDQVEKFEINPFKAPDVYATNKQGWLLLGGLSSFLVFNPFLNEVIQLPYLGYFYKNTAQATFSVNNSPSRDFEVFAVCHAEENNDAIYVCSYNCSSGKKKWSKKLVDTTEEECLSVHYMDGKLYCAFEEGVLKRYTVKDQSWDLLTLGSDLDCVADIDRCWLNEDKGGLIMVSCEWDYEYGIWHIFRFDWSDMKWDLEKSLNNTAFFISGRVLLKTPLVDKNGEKMDDCRVFFHDVDEDDQYYDDESKVKCYSFRKRGLVETQEFGWRKWSYGPSISFIEPPYFGK